MTINQKIAALKNDGEDFEFYPTTDEILACVHKSLIEVCSRKSYEDSYNSREVGISCETNYCQTPVNCTISISSMLDIGAGDGRVLDYMQGSDTHKIEIYSKYGIEIARAQADDLIRRGVALIGRDYFETVLIDKFFNVVFSNPPYSRYEEWVAKLLGEINANIIYLVLPCRWQDNVRINALVKSKGKFEILGSYDFSDGERMARAKVDVIKIECKARQHTDAFVHWVEENIGKFECDEKADMKPEAAEAFWGIEERGSDKILILIENYKKDLAKLMDTYVALGKVDPRLLKQLHIIKADIIARVKSDIDSLKNQYWLMAFNVLEPVKSRLTYKTRLDLMRKIEWFKELDFNSNNIYTIVIWVIEHFNKYTQEQMLTLYHDLTDYDLITAYKSNNKWLEDSWRYGRKNVPEKYVLDYRIVVRVHQDLNDKWKRDGNPIADLAIVASSLGFKNSGIVDYSRKEKHECLDDNGNVLFEYRIHNNNNVHFKLRKDLLRAFNIEVGKLKGWLKKPADIVEEFDVTAEEAERWFSVGSLQLMNMSNQRLIAFQE